MCGTGNVALAGTQGGPEKYDMYLRYGAPPTAAKWDWKAEVNETFKKLGLVNQSLYTDFPLINLFHF